MERDTELADQLFVLIFEVGEGDALQLRERLGWSHLLTGRAVQELEADGVIEHLGDWQVRVTALGRAVFDEW
jgi:hypothetical protein